MKNSLAPALLAFLFFALPLTAQDYHVEVKQFSIEEGLSHREVHDVMQDSRGLIWVSTRYGLNRFDGHRFTWFTKEKHGLSSNNIIKVVEDAQGWLWVFTAREGADNAVEFVDLMHVRSLELMPWAERRAPFSPSDIVEVVAGPEREIFFGLKKGGCWKLGINGVFTPLPSWEKKRFFPRFCSTTGTIWGFDTVATVANLMEINISSGEVLKKFQHVRGFEFVFAGEDASGQLWYSASKNNDVSIFFIDPNGQRHQYDLANIPIGGTSRKFAYGFPRLHINPHDLTYWWRAENVFAFSTPDGKPAALHQGEYTGLNYSRQVVFDKDGRGWVGCADGVYSVKLKPSRFKNLLAQPFQEADFQNNIECRGMAKAPNGEVYVNSYQGTFRLSPDGRILSDNFLGVSKDEKWASMAMHVDPTGDTWFGWLRPARLDAKTGAIHTYQLPSHTIYEQPPDKKLLHVWDISRQPNGRTWFVGLNGHFGYLEPGADTVQLFENYGGFEELKNASILDMQQGPDGKAWLAANTGLYLFDPERQKILQRYWTGGEGRFRLPHDNIHHVFQDGDSLLWIATGGGGLVRLAVAQGGASQFTKSDGLASDLLYAVYPDEYGNLWLPSDYGIIQFNKASKMSRTFLPGDGLPHHEFNRISHHQATDGQLYFGCLNGLTTFHPRDFQDFSVKNEAPLVLLGMEQFDGGQNRLVNNLTQFMDYPEIVLHPGDRVVNLEFALLDYNAPERINYAYRIEGVDEEWTYLRENRISLSGLPYGDFVLKIRGQAATGVFSSEQLSIPLHVLKPLYLETWFLLLAALILLVAGQLVYKIRTRQLESQKRRLEVQVRQRTETIQRQNEQLAAQAGELRHLDEVKSRFFANVSHELRTPLTLLLGPIGSVLKSAQLDDRSSNLLQKAQRSGKDLLQLINEILDLSKMESGRMELHEKPVLLYRLLRRWFSQFDSHAYSQGLELVFEYRASEGLQVLLDAEKFEKVVNNFLSNAIKFTQKGGRVTLHFEELDSKLLLNVTDTGQGIHPDDLPKVFDRFYQTNRPDAPAEGGTGIGLALVNEYAHLFGGKTWVDSELGKGSTFFFEFPKKLVAAGDWKPLATEETPEEIAPLPTLPATDREATSTANRPTILVVEDNPDMRDYLRLNLEEKYNVVTAENGHVAWDLLMENGKRFMANGGTGIIPHPSSLIPDLIISDLMMPVMDGYQLLEKLKSDDRWRHLPVVMLTARAGLRDKLQSLRIGVDDYMTKPFEEEELLARVDNLLRHSEWRRQYLQEEMEPAQGNEVEPDDAPAQPSPAMSEEDSAWLEDLENTVKEKLGDFDFSLEQLAHKMASNRWTVYRRIKQLTGLTAAQYLKEIRLNHARHLLEQKKYTAVKALSLDVGMKDFKYFSQEFKQRFGKLPSDYF